MGCICVCVANQSDPPYYNVTNKTTLNLFNFRLVVSQNQRALHIVFQHQFLDSPEWFGVSTDDYFQVYRIFILLNGLCHKYSNDNARKSRNQFNSTHGVYFFCLLQVSIMAMEESRVLIWHRDKLRLSIIGEPYLQTVFDHVLGKDVVKKLMQVTQVSGIGHTHTHTNNQMFTICFYKFDFSSIR